MALPTRASDIWYFHRLCHFRSVYKSVKIHRILSLVCDVILVRIEHVSLLHFDTVSLLGVQEWLDFWALHGMAGVSEHTRFFLAFLDNVVVFGVT